MWGRHREPAAQLNSIFPGSSPGWGPSVACAQVCGQMRTVCRAWAWPPHAGALCGAGAVSDARGRSGGRAPCPRGAARSSEGPQPADAQGQSGPWERVLGPGRRDPHVSPRSILTCPPQVGTFPSDSQPRDKTVIPPVQREGGEGVMGLQGGGGEFPWAEARLQGEGIIWGGGAVIGGRCGYRGRCRAGVCTHAEPTGEILDTTAQDSLGGLALPDCAGPATPLWRVLTGPFTAKPQCADGEEATRENGSPTEGCSRGSVC